MTDPWAIKMLQSNAVILDTETTGLNGHAEIVQLAILDMAGNVLLDTLLRPTRPIPQEVTALHGIADRHVADAPTIRDLIDRIKLFLAPVPVVIYNAQFDTRVLTQSLRAYNLDTAWVLALDVSCCMKKYSNWMNSSKWLPLRSGQHEAVGDCRATLEVIRFMADKTQR